MAALTVIGETYFRDDPVAKRRVVVEMGLEATRNPRVAEIFHGAEKHCTGAIVDLFRRLKDEGRIAPAHDIDSIARVFMLIGDGLLWRRACVPDFDVRDVLPLLTELIAGMVRPVDATKADTSPGKATPRPAAGQRHEVRS